MWDAVGETCLGDEFTYAYDEVGNRTSQTVGWVSTTYVYDDANRLTSVNGVTYTYDANGNLLDDGANTYVYDYANRLVSLCTDWDAVGETCLGDEYSYTYNGRGDRLQQTVNGVTTTYLLDLNAGLTQILEDGSAMYLYGYGRLGEYTGSWAYYAADGLGSVRQLVEDSVTVQFSQTYEPYGDVLISQGDFLE